MAISTDIQNMWREIRDDSWTRTSQVNRLVLLVKEPTSLFAYWAVDALHKRLVSEHFQMEWVEIPLYLRIYDVSDIMFDGHNANSAQTIQVHADSNNWYITNLRAARRYAADFGTTTVQGQFFSILRSNVAETPPQFHARTLEPTVRFGSPHSATETVKAEMPMPKVGRELSPFNDQAWLKQFDGYHLVGNTGGDA